MKQRELKKEARKNFKAHYWIFVNLCLIAAFIGSEFHGSLSSINSIKLDRLDLNNRGLLVLTDFLSQIGGSLFQRSHGIFAGLVNAFYTESIPLNLARIMEGIFQSENIALVLMILISALLYLTFVFLLAKPYQVILRRMMLEGRCYEQLPFIRIMYLLRIKKFLNVVLVMLTATLFQFLWWFTLIGGIIKVYSYRMVPFILAENPGLGPMEVITLSRRMMDGNKLKCFFLDVSFWGWALLSAASFGILGILWVNPYKLATLSEFYVMLREGSNEKILNDRYLYEKADKQSLMKAYPMDDKYPDRFVVEPQLKRIPKFLYQNFGVCIGNQTTIRQYDQEKVKILERERIFEVEQGKSYPTRLAPIQEKERNIWAESHNYLQSYSVVDLILIFFILSITGWIWEVSIHLIRDGVFVNRGVLHGPWLPIYGTGSLLILILLYRFRDHPGKNFLMIVLLCGIVEYFTSWYLQMTHDGMKWWDYSGYFLNINGRICGEGLLVFGLGGLAVVYILAPILAGIFDRLPKKVLVFVCCVLLTLFIADQVYSSKYPNEGKGVTDYTARTAYYVEMVESFGVTHHFVADNVA